MEANEIQKQLDDVYKTVLNKEIISSQFADEEKSVLSAPFLLNIPDSYCKSKNKILYIGKETNIWWGKIQHYIDIKNSIEILKNRYKAEFEGGEVQRSKDISKIKTYKPKDWGNNAFFSKFSFFEDNIKDSSILWTNLLKMDSGVDGYAKNSIHYDRIKQLSKDILLKEIDILKPDAIIFVTATSTNLKHYDSAIKNTFDNKYTNSHVIKSKELWIFEYSGIKCYRTLHPLSYQYKSKEQKHNHYKDIADDINNGFNLFKRNDKNSLKSLNVK